MTVPDNTGEIPAGTDSVTQEPETQETGNAAPWEDYVKDFDPMLRQRVEPVFKEWDKNVTERFQKVHSEYEPYKAYEPFVRDQIDPQLLQNAMALVERINNNPREVYDLMAQQFGFSAEQGQQGEPQGTDEEDEKDPFFDDPRYKNLEASTKAMQDYMAQQAHEKEQVEITRTIDAELAAVEAKYGEMDRGTKVFVLTQMANGIPAEEARKQFEDIVSARVTAAKAPPAPIVMGSGGGVPVSTPVNPSTMTSAERKKYIADVARRAAESD